MLSRLGISLLGSVLEGVEEADLFGNLEFQHFIMGSKHTNLRG